MRWHELPGIIKGRSPEEMPERAWDNLYDSLDDHSPKALEKLFDLVAQATKLGTLVDQLNLRGDVASEWEPVFRTLGNLPGDMMRSLNQFDPRNNDIPEDN